MTNPEPRSPSPTARTRRAENFRRRFLWLGPALVLLAAIGVAGPSALRVHRHRNAIKRYDAAVAAYMFYDVQKAERLFAEVARSYGDLPVGALSELKLAFLVYDEDRDLDRAEMLFTEFLDTHPETVLHLPQTPQPFEYFGELELVAWFFLGKIAADRGDPSTARIWFVQIVDTGSRNPANYIVAETRSILRKMNALQQAAHATGGPP